ncbi:zinc finger protein family memeber [Trypanosoma rangeli]|uniref:Zinc finger protein family memeber n=1 Tax=Trypanosoma rangeli TaxID=5698 RepID=A0A422P0I5_TRYRA|nr:zinc finger protein family memeber [Trypanosoma rangeli]RNF11236.1 zinc finger protein family memeber [Trypanosoma rangeli]|eukprot:RNF11236.1 zinc finger protein family memeber [Trypanosoma rangeli]
MYQAHFGDKNTRETTAAGNTKSRFFGSAINPSSRSLRRSSVSFTPHSQALRTNSGGLPTCIANQSVTPATNMSSAGNAASVAHASPAPVLSLAPHSPINTVIAPFHQPLQQQTVFVVNVGDVQPIPCVPVQQVVLASPSPLNAPQLLTSEAFNTSHSRSSSGNFSVEGTSRDVAEGGFSPLTPVGFVGEPAVLGFQNLASPVASPNTHIFQSPLHFAYYLPPTPLEQGDNKLATSQFANFLSNDGSSQIPAPVNNTTDINGKEKMDNVNGEPHVEVYAPDFTCIISLPVSAITQLPHSSLGVSRLVLCRKYVPGHPDSCWKGAMCKFVHADPMGALQCPIHVNYSWRSVERCTYQRLPAGEMIVVLAPNGREPAETFPSERVLVTRGSLNRKTHAGPPSRCAHYYFNRLCNRGENCNFIHTIHVDPNVEEDFKRAPACNSIAPIKKRNEHAKPLASERSDGLSKGDAIETSKKTAMAPCSVGHNNIPESFDFAANTVSSTNSNFYLAVPQNATRLSNCSVPSVGGASARSSSSGVTNPIEWTFVDNLDCSIWSDGEKAPLPS